MTSKVAIYLLSTMIIAGCSPGEDDTGFAELDTDGDGWTLDEGDCDDGDPSVHPDASEVVADGIDQDCDGYDECYRDEDLDGYGTSATITSSGEECTGYGESAVSTDCDDEDPAIHPGAEEVCNDGVDDDCDGLADDEDPDVTGTVRWFADKDEDGYGDVEGVVMACRAPEGYVANWTDCDDTDLDVHLGATETWYDGVDQDCDGNDTDADGDGYPWEGAGGDDCDDRDPDVNPGMKEICENGLDDDCDGYDDRCRPTSSLSEADATFRGAPWATAGSQVAPAGDFDGDGNLDIAIGSAWDADDAGRVQVMTGPFSGEYDLEDAGIVLEGDPASYSLAGYGLAGGLDTDGDGFGAVVVGTAALDPSAHGWAFLVEGPVSGVLDLGEADCVVEGEEDNDWAGASVAFAGDATGDGVDDWLVGALASDFRGNMSGAAYLLSGTKRGTWSLADADARLLGEAAEDHAGYSVSGAGDVDGDGWDDILVGAPGTCVGGSSSTCPKTEIYAGTAYLFLGPVSGTLSLGSADALFRGDDYLDWRGFPVARAGDVEGDGYADFLVGARGEATVYVLHGPLAGALTLADVEGMVVGDDSADDISVSLDGAGDVDGDGTPDIVIGARLDDEVGEHAGAAWLVYGPVEGSVDLEKVGTKFLGVRAGDVAGQSVAGVGDIDEDGFDDFLVGAYKAPGGLGDGAAYLIYGWER